MAPVFIPTAKRNTGLALVAVLVASGCADSALRALLTIRVEDEAYRPEHLLLTWEAPQGAALRDVRVPAEGDLPRTGAALATVLVDLDVASPGDRQVTLRGIRGGRVVSGATGRVPWDPGRQVEVILTLGCVLDPATAEPSAGCPSRGSEPDAGAGPLSVSDALDAGDQPVDGPAAPPVDAASDLAPDLAADAAPAGDLAVDRTSPPPPGPDAGGPDGAAPPPDAVPDAADGPPTDVAAPPAGVDLNAALVLYLKLDDGPPSKTPRDSSGNANMAMLMNLDAQQAWVPGQSGQAIALPGGATPGWISVKGSPALDQIGGDLSVSLWVRAPADPTGGPGTILTRAASAGGALYSLQLVGNRPLVRLNTSQAGPGLAPGVGTLPADRWVHLAFVYDRTHVFLYLNGRPAGAGSHQLGFAPEITPLLIGGSQGYGNTVIDPFTGQLDEIAVYARALSMAEVRALAAGFQPQAR
jgi:hypothetical protein